MRFLAWLRAKLGGYFWHPCPVCGRNFGGHEIGGELVGVVNRATCRRCPGQYIKQAGSLYEIRAHMTDRGPEFIYYKVEQ